MGPGGGVMEGVKKTVGMAKGTKWKDLGNKLTHEREI